MSEPKEPTAGKLEQILAEQHAVVETRCARCRWTIQGPVTETAAAFREHLASVHPEIASAASPRRRRLR